MCKLEVWEPAPSRFFRGRIGVAITPVRTRRQWKRKHDAPQNHP
jgi:hypothetical protein